METIGIIWTFLTLGGLAVCIAANSMRMFLSGLAMCCLAFAMWTFIPFHN